MADKVQIPQEAPGPASEPASKEGAAQFALTAAMALIVGSIIGVGVFNLPTSLASYGPITLVSMALTIVGALALAMLFAALHQQNRRGTRDHGAHRHDLRSGGNRRGIPLAGQHRLRPGREPAAHDQGRSRGHPRITALA
jgi:basic amino acid/polyamine antiporter, APA family